MDGDKRILYVPIENRVRELDARLLLSLKAASAGFQVILGPRWHFTANRNILPRGFYAFKTLNKIDSVEMKDVRRYGHTPIAWDEEGPGQIVPAIYLKSINDDAVTHTDKIYSWGENQSTALASRYPDAKGKIEAVGNPRWDILRPKYQRYFAPEADAIRARHGRFILLNTNFSSYNAVTSREHIMKVADQAGAFSLEDQADQKMLADIMEFERENFERYLALIPKLSAAFPNHTIVVRPHPTENHGPWKEAAAPLANVQCVFEGDVVRWLIAAEAVIQNSCTTGVEALTLGKPVVSYCKGNSPLLEWHLANQVCPRVHDEEELVAFLQKYTADPSSFADLQASGKRTLAKHISNLDGETSSEALIKSFIAHATEREMQGVTFDRTFTPRSDYKVYPYNDYQRLKLPPIAPTEIVEKLRRLAKLEPGLNTLTMAYIAESCFFFSRA